ncbi:MAG TPA: hypothetical protein VIN38_11290 [Thiobacillus sp.]
MTPICAPNSSITQTRKMTSQQSLVGPIKPNQVCPVCGNNLIESSRISFSIADVIGAGFLVIMLGALLILFIKVIGWVSLLLAVPILILVTYLVFSGGAKELGGYRYIGGIWDQAGVIGGILFLIWAVIRYFVRFDVIKEQTCTHCGFHKGRD